ncbi:MAG: nascent polypeptide-associated complex protein [Candidatus Caldarchaeales archaeon]|nr:nascent polypeptide-associated complex protein [Candidatus Caldarchaeales archaeon]
MKRLGARELRRMQERMLSSLGLSMKELGQAREVLIDLEGKTIRIRGANVIAVNTQAGRMYQIVGGEEVEEAEAKTEITAYEPNQEDVALVASQAEVSLEEARQALIDAGGDLARAILNLRMKRTG